MSDKKWHWRMRTSGLYFAEHIARKEYDVVFVTAVINLAELVGLRTDLNKARKILYFHENQLVYPVRKYQDRDFQYGYNQIISCLSADIILFNSLYNMTSFLENIQSFVKLIPDYRPKRLMEKIAPKCEVLYFPLDLPTKPHTKCLVEGKVKQLHIVWPHRWEHDKNPEELFAVLFQLHEEGCSFNVSVIGQVYHDIPEIFEEGKSRLNDHILNWGYQDTKDKYMEVLQDADVVVSTAIHEFFGVAMLEAVSLGCYPLCPNRLVYPEFLSAEYLYNTKQQLAKKLKYFCKKPQLVRSHNVQVDFSKFNGEKLAEKYLSLFLHESSIK